MSLPNRDHTELALTYLRLAHQTYRDHYAQRVYFAKLARQYGLTNQQIADAYELTEGAIRKMLQREGDA